MLVLQYGHCLIYTVLANCQKSGAGLCITNTNTDSTCIVVSAAAICVALHPGAGNHSNTNCNEMKQDLQIIEQLLVLQEHVQMLSQFYILFQIAIFGLLLALQILEATHAKLWHLNFIYISPILSQITSIQFLCQQYKVHNQLNILQCNDRFNILMRKEKFLFRQLNQNQASYKHLCYSQTQMQYNHQSSKIL
ncbi:unnamed protein product [Paramecium octaurelia]|uniref:Transmembrane protein n=1 Tax=Paramecium octaurelia TaxID=43137 RepID=A0A8S1X4U0_PAROT|nr:unnamed protein product [Paramecium octaurelia]